MKEIDRKELRNRQRCLSAISDSIDTDPRLSLNVDVSKTYHCPSKVTTGTKYPKNHPKTQSPSSSQYQLEHIKIVDQGTDKITIIKPIKFVGLAWRGVAFLPDEILLHLIGILVGII